MRKNQEKVDDAFFAILRALRKWENEEMTDEDVGLVFGFKSAVSESERPNWSHHNGVTPCPK